MKNGTSKTCPKFAFEVVESEHDPEMIAVRLTRNGFQTAVETIPRDAAPAVGLALLSYRPADEIEDDPAKEWFHLGAQDMLVDCIKEVKHCLGNDAHDLRRGILARLEARRDPNVTVRECKAEDLEPYG